jgi:hypothetical protein
MGKKDQLKSAYELAMERLTAEDRAAGRAGTRSLTEAQKERIAELRRTARAKLAELEILHRKNVAAVRGDPEQIRELEEHFEVDRRRVESTLEDDVARVREGG